MNTENRNYKIDILRTIGTFLVILAHMQIPAALSHIRTFDVVMLVWISGISFAISYEDKRRPYGRYLKKRVEKLIIPVWVLITVIFIASYIVCLATGHNQLYSTQKMLLSYLFSDDGIGYIWIAKVYFLIAVISYMLYALNKKIKNDVIFFLCITVLLSLNQILVFVSVRYNIYVLKQYFLYLLSYSTVAVLGMRCYTNKGFTKKCLIYSGSLFAVLQVIQMINHLGFAPGNYKYPPEVYYLFYGIFVGTVLYLILPNIKIKKVTWFSLNSYSIYLFHILIMLAYNMSVDILKLELLEKWYIEFPIVVALSIICTLLLNKSKQMMGGNKNVKTEIKE